MITTGPRAAVVPGTQTTMGTLGGGAETIACAQPAGHVAVSGDCDDDDATTYPSAPETCDGIDQDCDDAIDDDAVDLLTWYADRDLDGYGAGVATAACDAPAEHVDNGDDCDDTSAGINPGATETCSGIDEDCDTLLDADDPDMTGLATWYLDADGDDHGARTTSVESCARPTGYALDPDDCDDADATAYPGADETCDGVDEDCDTVVDDGAIDASVWYADTDEDGFGDAASATTDCEAPADTVSDAADCDDTDGAVFPGAAEACDTLDNDCDGVADEGEWYADSDADTFGDAAALDTSCAAPAGFVADATDCDDTRGDVSPTGAEVCDGADADEDCDGLSDDADVAAGGTLWYPDGDGDTYGAGAALTACDAPAGYVSSATDCDDADGAVSPAGTESCGGGDEDCDGLVDDDDASPTGTTTWYLDADADGFGSTTSAAACLLPAGYAATDDDCVDTDDAISPDAYESCNDGVDQDCDGADATVCDADGDGYDVSTDCDDANADVNPGEREVCDAGDVDEDCDGVADDDDTSALATTKTRYYEDVDADGYGDPGGSLQCDIDAGYVANNEDCNDGDGSISPDASDICASSVDEDCSGEVDDCTRYDIDGAALTVTGSPRDFFGKSIVAGDFGGGYTLVVGAPYLDGTYADEGGLYLFDASARGTVASTAASATIDGSGSSYFSYAGTSLHVGDTDGDGVDDLCVDTLYLSYIVYGADVSAGGLLSDLLSATSWGEDADFLDVDGDGLADLGSIGTVGSSTRAYSIAYGPAFGTYSSTTVDCLIEMDTNAPWYARGVDFDGDGTDGLALVRVGTSVYVFHDPCSAARLSDSDAEIAASTSSSAAPYLGALGAGDVDGDGNEELVVGGVNSYSTGAVAWLVPSPSSSGDVDTLASASLVADGTHGYSFLSVATGDFDGDAVAEVALINVNEDDGGQAFILDGWSGAVTMSDLAYPGVGAQLQGNADSFLGDAITNVGDTDGDGTDDLGVSNAAYYYDLYGGTVPTSTWLWLGSDIFR